MALNDGLQRPRGNDIDDREHYVPAVAKKVVFVSADGSGNGADVDSNGNIGTVIADADGTTANVNSEGQLSVELAANISDITGDRISTRNLTQEELLLMILNEVRKLNLHLTKITGETLDNVDFASLNEEDN